MALGAILTAAAILMFPHVCRDHSFLHAKRARREPRSIAQPRHVFGLACRARGPSSSHVRRHAAQQSSVPYDESLEQLWLAGAEVQFSRHGIKSRRTRLWTWGSG